MANTIQTSLKVLDAITQPTTTTLPDIYIDSNGILQGLSNAVNANSISSVTIAPKVTQVLQVTTFLIATGTANSTYSITINAFNSTTGALMAIPVSYANGSSTNTTTIATAVAAAINAALTGSNVIATTSTATVILTAVSALTTPSDNLYTFPAPTTNDAKITTITSDGTGSSTVGVAGVGYGSQLAAKYFATTLMPPTANGWNDASLIVTTKNYTEVTIIDPVNGKSVILINEADGDIAYLTGTAGTITGLKQRYRVTFTSSSTTQALITITNGIITLDGGSQTFGTLGALPGDFMIITQAGGTAFTTLYTTRIQSIGWGATGTASQLSAIGDNIVALPATSEDFKLVKWRPIPY